jgi:hypothetical protein
MNAHNQTIDTAMHNYYKALFSGGNKPGTSLKILTVHKMCIEGKAVPVPVAARSKA